MGRFRNITFYGVVTASLTSGGFAQDINQLTAQDRNANIVGERQSRENLRKVLEAEKKKNSHVGDSLKESIINYQKPDASVENIRFKLKKIRFTPKSQLLEASVLRKIAKKYTHREISFNDLQKLRVDVINAYQERGYTLSTVNIPAQKLENDTLKIELVESKIKRVEFENNLYIPDSYFDAFVGKYRERFFNVRQLERDLVHFNKVSKASMVAKSRASDEFSYSDLIFQVYEPARFSTNFSIDNYGTKRLGELRFLSSASVYGVVEGYDDNLVIGTTQSKGNNSWYGVYDRPLNTYGTRASITATVGRTTVTTGQGDDLQIVGNSSSYNARVTHPLRVTQNMSLYASLGYRYSDSRSLFVGSFLDNTRSDTLFADITLDHVDDYGSWYGQLSASMGYSKRFDEDSQGYQLFNASVRRVQRLNDDWLGTIEVNSQYSLEERLPNTANYYVGGQSSVRGYEDGAAVGAHGYTAKLDLSTNPFSRLPLPDGHTLKNVRLSFFYDYAVAYTRKGGGVGLDPDTFSSAGVYAYYQPITPLFLSVGYAKPIDFDEELFNERNFHFSIQYKLTF